MKKKDRILAHLKAGYRITQKEAVERYNAYRLSAVVFQLKKEGYRISTKMISNGTSTFAEYRLLKDGELF